MKKLKKYYYTAYNGYYRNVHINLNRKKGYIERQIDYLRTRKDSTPHACTLRILESILIDVI
jgi:hypothetical protein